MYSYSTLFTSCSHAVCVSIQDVRPRMELLPDHTTDQLILVCHKEFSGQLPTRCSYWSQDPSQQLWSIHLPHLQTPSTRSPQHKAPTQTTRVAMECGNLLRSFHSHIMLVERLSPEHPIFNVHGAISSQPGVLKRRLPPGTSENVTGRPDPLYPHVPSALFTPRSHRQPRYFHNRSTNFT